MNLISITRCLAFLNLVTPTPYQIFEILNTKPRITHFEEDRYFKDFMRRIELIPNGLVFLGPPSPYGRGPKGSNF